MSYLQNTLGITKHAVSSHVLQSSSSLWKCLMKTSKDLLLETPLNLNDD